MRNSIMSNIMILLCCVAAEIILLGGNKSNMGMAEWVAIGIGLFGVAGGIWGQFFQFRKDAQRIDGVNKTASDVKTDTTAMMPLVDRTDKNVQQMRDKLISRENMIDSTMNGISELLESKHIEDVIKNKVSATIDNPLYIQNAVKLVYEKNAALELNVSELSNEKFHLNARIQALEHEKNKLYQDNQVLSNEVNKLRAELDKQKNHSEADREL